MSRFLLLALLACGPGPRSTDAAGSALQVLERARLRPTPDPVRGRLHLSVEGDALAWAGGTGGVLIVDRPGLGHLAVMGPLGGPLATVTSDGVGLAVAIPRDRRQLASPDADRILRDATEGLLGLDDLVGLLLGDVPFDQGEVRRQRPLDDGAVEVHLAGPDGTRLVVVLEPVHATPVSARVFERTGRELLNASFEPFEVQPDGTVLPTRVTLGLPALALGLDLKFKAWERLDEVPPVFDNRAPEGWSVEPLSTGWVDDVTGWTGGHP